MEKRNIGRGNWSHISVLPTCSLLRFLRSLPKTQNEIQQNLINFKLIKFKISL
jgi:hypothetical protein